MVKYRKRLEALSEIYRSEVLYVEDLKIWGEEFRRYLFQSETLTIEKKHALSRTLFINLDSIIALHEIIIKELYRRNSMMAKQQGITLYNENGEVHITEEIADKYKDLEYHSVYYKYLDRFNSYKYYVSRLPTVEFNLDKECSQNMTFAKELAIFFEKRGINLGPKHFIYRASQKLARYSILWKAALHYEENATFRCGIEQLMKRLKEITLEVDKTYGNINESYKVYRFSSELYYSSKVKKRIPLNLFQKRRTIIKESDIIVKDKNITEAELLRFILLDTLILLCDVVRQGNIELKYIISDPMPLYKYTVTDKNIGFSIENEQLMEMSKLFILEIGGRDITVLFFRDGNTRNMYKNIIQDAINKQRESFRDEIQIRKIFEQTDLKIQCCATRKENVEIGSTQLCQSDTEDELEKKPSKFDLDKMTDFQKRTIKIIKRDTQKSRKYRKGKRNQIRVENFDNHCTESNEEIVQNTDIEQNRETSDYFESSLEKKLTTGKPSLTKQNQELTYDALKSEKFQNIPEEKPKERIKNTERKPVIDIENLTILEERKESKADKKTELKIKNEVEHNPDCQLTYESCNKSNDGTNTESKNLSNKSEDIDTLLDVFCDSSSESSSGCVCNFKNQIHRKVTNRHGRQLNFETKVLKAQVTDDSSSDTIEDNARQRRPSIFGRLFKGPKNTTKSRSLSINRGTAGLYRLDEEILLFGTDKGLFSKRNTEFENIYDDPVEKIIYDASNKIICFLSECKIKVATFVPPQTNIETKTIANKVSDFFYGKTANKLTIASLTVSNSATTTISLFKVVIENDVISVVMDRKLFVGCLVYEISFFETMLVIACKDFEMVDSDTLKTQELVDPLDLCIPFYFKELKTVTALCVFTISRDLYLVCYDTMGFFIDKYGRTVKQDTIFVWYFTPSKFKVHRGFLICLGEQEIAIWTLSNGRIIYNKKIDNLRFVKGASSLLLHDEHNMYKVDL